jgi:hypothetical protein
LLRLLRLLRFRTREIRQLSTDYLLRSFDISQTLLKVFVLLQDLLRFALRCQELRGVALRARGLDFTHSLYCSLCSGPQRQPHALRLRIQSLDLRAQLRNSIPHLANERSTIIHL